MITNLSVDQVSFLLESFCLTNLKDECDIILKKSIFPDSNLSFVSKPICKISHFLKCSDEIRNNIIFTDIPEIIDTNNEIETTEMNCFTLNPESESIYNNPLIDANDKYLVDDNGTKYSSWEDFFDKNKEQK